MNELALQDDRHDDLPGQLWELWQKGLRPDVSVFLATAGPLSLTSRVAVLRIDQQQRWLSGERILVERYLNDHPSVRRDEDQAVELIYCEYLIREELGEAPELEDYLSRFPAFAPRLRQQIDVHEALGRLSGSSSRSVPIAAAAESVAEAAALHPTIRPFPATPPVPVLDLPGYAVVRELGRGGMGVVYEVRELRTDKHVALKVMQWADAMALYRFKQEFRSLAGLNHPNLVGLHELSAQGQTWFFTMELLDGEPLLEHVRGGDRRRDAGLTPAAVGRLRAALAQLAGGLNFLHAAGKLHRDVKPGNVLVTRGDGRVVLLDFGLAAEMDRTGLYLSLQPRLLGTIAYMAPEQAACLSVGPATDWYAVGAMLFEALTGRPPFDGAPVQVLLHKQQFDPPSPRDLVANLPDDLVRLCEHLLRRNPAERPTGAEVCRRLGGAAETIAPSPRESSLVRQSAHLEQLAGAFERMRQGRTVVASIHGRSGAGKTALLRRFLDDLECQSDAVVLSGRCFEHESVPYKALDSLIDSLSRYLESLPRLLVEALLPRDVSPLAQLFPVLRQVSAFVSAPKRDPETLDPVELHHQALAGLRELLARLGDRRRLVLAIDDLQWGDEDSAAVLADLLSPADRPTLLLVASYRSEDADSSCLRAFARIGAGVLDRVDVPIEPLAEEQGHKVAQVVLV